MSETPTSVPPPRKSPASGDKPVEDKAAETVHETTDKVASEAKGFRARVRAIRNDEDIRSLTKDAKPFLAGAAIVGGAFVDPVLTATVAVNRIGRRIQTAYQHTKAHEAAHRDTTES